MKVLLTGACGFIGGHVLDRLLADGHEVLGVDCLEPRVHASGKKPVWFPPDVDLLVTTVDHVPYWALTEAEVVIHLAAQVGVADSMEDPMRYVSGNSLQTQSFLCDLRAALDRGNLRRLVVASSMSIYGNGGMLVSEKAPCVPASVYGLTKYDQERQFLMFGEQFRKQAVALRFFNCFGPRQAMTNPYTGVLANFAQAVLNGQPPLVFEDGGQTRDFIYVADVADAVVRAATMQGPLFGAYNICTGWPTTLLTAAREMTRVLQRPDIEPVVTGLVRPGDVRDCTGNPDAFRRETGWLARYSFASGMERYAEGLLA